MGIGRPTRIFDMHYARLDNDDLDDNNNKRVLICWFKGQSGYTYDAQIDVELGESSIRQAHPWMYTANGERFDKYALDGAAIVEYITTLSDYKANKNAQIDRRTRELIVEGFMFDNQTFSASIEAQKNWLAIEAAESKFTFPIKITTIDDQEYSLAQVDKDDFIQTGIDHVKGHIDSGRALKLDVNAAADKAAVDAVEDNR